MRCQAQAGKAICLLVKAQTLERRDQHHSDLRQQQPRHHRKSTFFRLCAAFGEGSQSKVQYTGNQTHGYQFEEAAAGIFSIRKTVDAHVGRASEEIAKLHHQEEREQQVETDQGNTGFGHSQKWLKQWLVGFDCERFTALAEGVPERGGAEPGEHQDEQGVGDEVIKNVKLQPVEGRAE